jgi:CDP-4-dehydro-6-deoxyglucose reductase/3-phenylpropionate/trans-cinnamate dioxygenase ferredoxin reductase subunit/phenol hydroxylase P5 protein
MAVEHTATLERIADHGPDTRSLFLRLPEPLRFVPGQFISCLLPVGSETLTRPYSIASDPESPDAIELLLDRVPTQRGSHHLFSLRLGATVRYTGPWGAFMLEEGPTVEAVFVAIGTGIAPIRPMVRRALATAVRPIVLLYATAPGGDPPYLDELSAPRPSYTAVRIATADVVDEVRRRFIDADADRSRQFFVCGVGEVVHTLRDRLRAAGYERRAVRYEKW